MDYSDDSSILLMDSPYSAAVGVNSAQVLFDASFRLAAAFDGQVESTSPASVMLDADVVRLGVQHGTVLTVSKLQASGAVQVGDFEVIGIEPDGIGLTRLILTDAEEGV